MSPVQQLYLITEDKLLREVVEGEMARRDLPLVNLSISQETAPRLRSHRNESRLLLDSRSMPHNGLNLIRVFCREGAIVPIALVANQISTRETIQAAKMGVVDVLEPPFQSRHVIATLDILLSAAITSTAPECDEIQHRFASLPEIEQQVLQLLIAGYTNKRAAGRLDLGLRTVVRYRSRAIKALGVHTIAQAAHRLGRPVQKKTETRNPIQLAR